MPLRLAAQATMDVAEMTLDVGEPEELIDKAGNPGLHGERAEDVAYT